MEHLKPQTENKSSQTHLLNNDYDDEDDFISFQYEHTTINLYYSHLSKYSRLIRKKYLFSDVQDRLPQELHKFQEQFDINPETIIIFFQLLQKDFSIDENDSFTFKQYVEFLHISDFLQIQKFTKKIIDYINSQKVEADFAIQIILYEIEKAQNTKNLKFQINKEIEIVLSSKINECFQNEKFAQIPISLIYRIIENCDMKNLSTDLLFDFMMKDLSKFNILFSFLEIQNLSEERVDFLCECYLNDSNRQFFGFLKCNLAYIMKLREDDKKIQKQLIVKENDNKLLQNKLNDLNSEKNQIQERLDQSEHEKTIITSKNADLKKKLDESEKARSLLEQEKVQLHKKIAEIENELKEEIEKHKSKITGTIIAKVKSDLIFNAEVHLIEEKQVYYELK